MKFRGSEIIKILKGYYKEGGVTLKAENPYRLLIATILSAQCTDERVNKVSPLLFEKYKDAYAMADAEPDDVKNIIKSLGFFNQKAKNIVNASKILAEKFKGSVPEEREALEKLPGVGRKTANIVLSRVFQIPAIAVDTHVKRVSKRLFEIKENDPSKIEKIIMGIFPVDTWNDVNLTLIFHGRKICKPGKPLCNKCPVNGLCKYYMKGAKYEHGGH